MIRGHKGQAILIAIMLLGSILSLLVVFGGKRQVDIADLVGKMDTTQTAGDVLISAARKVQRIYAVESGCDPRVLDSRISNLPTLPTTAASFGIGSASIVYAVAQPGQTTAAAKENRCTAASGCRQIAVPLERRVYVVTVGYVASQPPSASGQDCPRDATVSLSVAANGNVFSRRVTLTNICTMKSCNSTSSTVDDFDGVQGTISGAQWSTISACNGWSARSYGSLTGASLNLNAGNDLRWARRYLDTGGAAVGDTSYANNSTYTGTNASCAPTSPVGQCSPVNCVPPLDLNRDLTNNDADLAIFENFLRGYLPSLPVLRLE